MKWKRETLSLYVSAVLYLHFFPVAETVEKLVFIRGEKKWKDAYSHCVGLDGIMVTKEDLQAYEPPQCAISMSSVWTRNVIVVTPLLSLRACVNAYIDETTGHYIGQYNSVEQCAALCLNVQGFEIQRDYCRCFEKEPSLKVSAASCSYFCKEGQRKQFCGGESVSNVYIFEQRQLQDHQDGQECTFASCQGDREELTLVSSNNCSLGVSETTILCGDGMTPLKENVSDWLSACQRCVGKYGTYPIESLKEQNCCPDTCLECSNSNASHFLCSSTWTSTRRYRGNIVMQDAMSEDINIERCFYALLTSSKIAYIPASCEYSPLINTACKIDVSDEDNFTCYTTMNSSQPSVNTRVVETSIAQTSPVYLHESMTSTMGHTMDLSKGTDENDPPMGIIVGVILGLSVVMAVVVVIVLFRRRAMCFSGETKKTINKGMVYRSETERENVVIYQSTKDDEYDNLNVKRKHATETKSQSNIYHHVTNPMVKGNSENTYDEMMKHKNQHLSENTYYSHAKSPNPLLTGVTGSEYDISGHVQPVNETVSSENAYDVCSKSEDPT